MPKVGYRKQNAKIKRFEMRMTEEDYCKLLEISDKCHLTASEYLTKLLRSIYDDNLKVWE